jgi:hypothetical protein
LLEIYSSLDNNRANAVEIARGIVNEFTYELPMLETRYYWARVRRPIEARPDVFSDWLPPSPTAGISATTPNFGDWTPVPRSANGAKIIVAPGVEIQKSGGIGAWDSDCYSREAYSACYLSYRKQMSYTLQAILSTREMLERWRSESLGYVKLTERLAMVPLTKILLERFDIPEFPLTDEGEEPALPESLGSLCRKLSRDGLVVYLEAEIFGGAGLQAYVLFSNGTMIGKPVVAEDAINQGLRHFGVHSSSDVDEFDAVGLGRHRDTVEWMTDQT